MSDEFYPVVLGADIVDNTNSPVTRIMDAATKGVATAAISGGLSIYNTFRDYAGKDALDTYTTVRQYDESWGDFYAQHQAGVDAVGFIGASLIPGTLGVKALRLAQAGEAAGAISRALSITNTRKIQSLEAGLSALAESGGTVTAGLTSAKRAQLAWSVADNVLTSAAAETAIVATMNDSPMFEGNDFWDFTTNIATGAIFGGVLGGALDHWAARGVLKQAQSQIQKDRRLYDTVFGAEKLGLSKGDEVLNMTESIINLHDDFFNTNFSYTYDGVKRTAVLDTSDAFRTVRNRAEKVAFDNLSLKFNELAEGNELVGQSMFKFVRDKIQELKGKNVGQEQIIDEVQGYLQNLESVKGISRKSADAISLPTTTAKQVEEQIEKNRMFLDIESGSIRPTAITTVADLEGASQRIITTADSVIVGKDSFKQEVSRDLKLESSPLESSARYVWADRLSPSKLADREISALDFPLMDKLATTQYVEAAKTGVDDFGIKIKLPDGTVKSLSDIPNLQEFINQTKIDWMADQLGQKIKGYDVRAISAHVNQPTSWVENVITNNFTPTKGLVEASQDLKTYLKPKTLQVQYDFKTPQLIDPITGKGIPAEGIGPGFQVTAQLSHHYNLQTQLHVQDNAFRSVLGKDADLFVDAPQDLAKLTSEQGAGASALGAANANYGDRAELFVQHTGKQLATLTTKAREETIQTLAPFINNIRQDPQAAAELGILTTALRRDTNKYIIDTYVDVEGKSVYRLIDKDAVKLIEKGEAEDYDEAINILQSQGKRAVYDIKSSSVGEFLQNHTQINSVRVNKQTTLLNAAGFSRQLSADTVYVPPVDTQRYPFFAFVRAKERIGNNSDVTMITAKSEEQLRSLAGQVPEEYEVIFKQDTQKFFKAKGEYDYSMQINDSQVNSTLKRKGVLSDFFPETRAQNVLEDYVSWHGRQEESLLRQAVQVKYRQFFSEVGFLSEQYTSASTSIARGISGMFKSKIADPFQDYIKTALNISKQGEYPLLDSMNEFVDKIGKKAYEELNKARTVFNGNKEEGLASMQQANELAESYGLKSPYTSIGQYIEANSKFPKNLIKEGVLKVNNLLATIGLRLDFANSLVNIISTPIMLGTEVASIKQLISKDSELTGALNELMTLKVPGQDIRMPSTTKLMGKAIQNFFGPEKDTLLQRYKETGNITDISRMYHEMLSDVAYQPNATAYNWISKINQAMEKGAKFTGNNFSEEFTRFVSADVMRQISDPLVQAQRMTIAEQNAFITSFVNRVQGNYLYSQRPGLFQGTVGAAISLFQTYSFNVMQQLLRHMENGDKKTLLTFAGLQSSLYGLNGLPFFDAINSHLIGTASGNNSHADAYNTLPQFNKELGDWLLYGTASAFPLFGDKGPALYTRGDLNPRHISIIPINPLDIPAVDASIRLVSNIAAFGKNVSQGADMSQAMLQALEHQGWSRPLAGFAQVLNGQSTTSKGALISASNELETTSWLSKLQDRAINFGGVVRVLGAKPMDEALALNAMYKQKYYEAEDRAKIEKLGTAVKTKLYNGEAPTQEELNEFMQKYQSYGGRLETFSSTLQHWMKDANTSVVNQMAFNLRQPYSKKMQLLMGGTPLEDYSTLSQQSLE